MFTEINHTLTTSCTTFITQTYGRVLTYKLTLWHSNVNSIQSNSKVHIKKNSNPSLMQATVKPVINGHCFGRPPGLKDHFLKPSYLAIHT